MSCVRRYPLVCGHVGCGWLEVGYRPRAVVAQRLVAALLPASLRGLGLRAAYRGLEVVGAEQAAFYAAVESLVDVLLPAAGAGVGYRDELVTHVASVAVPDAGEEHRHQVLVAE